MVSHKFVKFDVDKKLAELSLAEKLTLLGGKVRLAQPPPLHIRQSSRLSCHLQDFWTFEDVPAKGIPSVRTSDGPNGVRGRFFFNGAPSSCFPCGTGLAASFDTEMVERVGEALADECVAKSAHVLLGPTVNIQRSPLGGRGFESYSEDPTLSGLVAAAYINGVQSKGVAACIKHFVAKSVHLSFPPAALFTDMRTALPDSDQEFERFSSSSEVSQRALREIYLEPFRLAVKHSHPKAFMTAYNRLNGLHCSENKNLLDGILRGEWGWKGLIMSDWTGALTLGLLTSYLRR